MGEAAQDSMSPTVRQLLRSPTTSPEDRYGAAASLHAAAVLVWAIPLLVLPVQLLLSGELRPAMLVNGFLSVVGAAAILLGRSGRVVLGSVLLLAGL